MLKYISQQNTPLNILGLLFSFCIVLAGCNSYPDARSPVHAQSQRPTQWAEPLNEKMNLFKVDELLYRSQQPTEKDIPQIQALGIKTIISLRAFNADDDIIKDREITLVRIPILTWHIRHEEVIQALKAIEEARQDGPVLLHCQHGADRTGLISAMYRIIYQDWTKEEAWQELREGGFGYSPIWTNIPQYIEQANIELMQQELAQ